MNPARSASLAGRVSGSVYTPADAGYAAEIAGFNTAVVHAPELVLAAASADDVTQAVRFARDRGHMSACRAPGMARTIGSPRGFSSPPDGWTA